MIEWMLVIGHLIIFNVALTVQLDNQSFPIILVSLH